MSEPSAVLPLAPLAAAPGSGRLDEALAGGVLGGQPLSGVLPSALPPSAGVSSGVPAPLLSALSPATACTCLRCSQPLPGRSAKKARSATTTAGRQEKWVQLSGTACPW